VRAKTAGIARGLATTAQGRPGVHFLPNGLANLEGLRDYETMYMIRKGQLQSGDLQVQVKFVDSLFGLSA
jgi:hypothetical protein